MRRTLGTGVQGAAWGRWEPTRLFGVGRIFSRSEVVARFLATSTSPPSNASLSSSNGKGGGASSAEATSSKKSAAISVFDMYTIGIGPSSSHTVGPMRAARKFASNLSQRRLLPLVSSVRVDLYGSLALTGEGHATPKAIMLGLEGETPEGVDPDGVDKRIANIATNRRLKLFGEKDIAFQRPDNLRLLKTQTLPFHSNGMEFFAFQEDTTVQTQQPKILLQQRFYSIGGGFFVDDPGLQSGDALAPTGMSTVPDPGTYLPSVPYPFVSANELVTMCEKDNISIAQLARINQICWTPDTEISSKLMNIYRVMDKCIERGCNTTGILPGGLEVRRRAPQLQQRLATRPASSTPFDWVSVYALAVNEENAAGGRVVTAPTNGAAGVIPAVLKYYTRWVDNANDHGVQDFLLTSAVVGMLFKNGASISAAEVGCQGEIGVACSMAAAGLAAALGGTPRQIEAAAEIGMEHNLGLTCDPVGGLVQIPCIERNIMGAIKAITSARLALNEDGAHKVSLDQVIATMMQTGKDMQTKYKETSEGGLAVNVTHC